MDILHPLHEIVDYREMGDRLEIKVMPDADKKTLLAKITASFESSLVMNADIPAIRKALLEATGKFVDIGEILEKYSPEADTFIFLTTTPLRCTLNVKNELLEHGIRPTVKLLQQRLKRANVTFGIKQDVIDKIIEKKLWEMPTIVADGVEPVRGENGSIKYTISTEAIYTPKINEQGVADYRDIQSFTQVKAGDLIAIRVPEGKGTPGTSIFGDPIPSEPGKPYELRPSANVIVSSDKNELRASEAGIIIKKDGIISVKSDLEIEGNVDFKVGNIHFAGRVIINGNVLAGFKIESEHDILIHGQVESSTVITTGGSIQVEKGVIGKDNTKISAKKDVIVNFAQDCTIEAEGTVTVETSLLHCKVICNEFKTTSPSSSVIGGEIIAFRSIYLANSGNEEETRTDLKIMDKKVIEIIEKRKKLSEAKEQLDALYVPADREVRNKTTMIKKAGIYATKEHTAGLEQAIKRLDTIKMKTQLVEKSIETIDIELRREDILEGDIFITSAINAGTLLEIHKKRQIFKKADHSLHFSLKDGELTSSPIRKQNTK